MGELFSVIPIGSDDLIFVNVSLKLATMRSTKGSLGLGSVHCGCAGLGSVYWGCAGLGLSSGGPRRRVAIAGGSPLVSFETAAWVCVSLITERIRIVSLSVSSKGLT